MSAVLLIDDDRTVIHLATRGLAKAGIDVVSASSAEEGVRLLSERGVDVDACLLDILLPGGCGLDAFKTIHALDPKLPVLFITGSTSSDLAIEAMKLGAFDYVVKPLDLPSLAELVQKAIDIRRKMSVPVAIADEIFAKETGDLIVGNSPAMQEVYKAIGRVAEQDVSVLIEGESGTGKELVARAIYQHSHRAQRAFLAVNCAAIPETLLESELFGHEKGGLHRGGPPSDRQVRAVFGRGRSSWTRSATCRACSREKYSASLQSQEFERVGGKRDHPHRRSRDRCDEPEPRTDGRRQRIPRGPLLPAQGIPDPRPSAPRAQPRPDSVAGTFPGPASTPSWVARWRRSPATPSTSSKGTPWPGNVRELENVVKQAILQATGTVIVPHFLPVLENENGAATARFVGIRRRNRPRGLDRETHSVGLGKPLRRSPRAPGAALDPPRARGHCRQPVAGRPDAGHHSRQSAEQDPRPEHFHRPCRRCRLGQLSGASPPSLARTAEEGRGRGANRSSAGASPAAGATGGTMPIVAPTGAGEVPR